MTQPAGAAVAVGATEGLVLAANPLRYGCIIVNTSEASQIITLGVNGNAPTMYAGVVLYPADKWVMEDTGDFVAGEIRGIASAADARVSVQELVK